jgi:hypothetical protein
VDNQDYEKSYKLARAEAGTGKSGAIFSVSAEPVHTRQARRTVLPARQPLQCAVEELRSIFRKCA